MDHKQKLTFSEIICLEFDYVEVVMEMKKQQIFPYNM